METATIIVHGNIQKVGYRAKVIDIADALGVKGEIENLKEGAVRIIACGDEDRIKEFAEKINIKNTLINVTNISVKPFATDKVYVAFKKVVKPKETDERLDSAVFYLKELINATNTVGEKTVAVTREVGEKNTSVTREVGEKTVAVMREGNEKLTKEIRQGNEKLSGKLDIIHDDTCEKQDKTIEILTETKKDISGKLDNIHNDLSVNLKSFHQDTINRFDIVDVKYGKITENMEKIFNEIKEERVESRKSMEKLIGAVIKLSERK